MPTDPADPAVELARKLRTCGCYDGYVSVLVCHEDQPGQREIWALCPHCDGTGALPEDVAVIRAALEAARVAERERCAEVADRAAAEAYPGSEAQDCLLDVARELRAPR